MTKIPLTIVVLSILAFIVLAMYCVGFIAGCFDEYENNGDNNE